MALGWLSYTKPLERRRYATVLEDERSRPKDHIDDQGGDNEPQRIAQRVAAQRRAASDIDGIGALWRGPTAAIALLQPPSPCHGSAHHPEDAASAGCHRSWILRFQISNRHQT